MWSRFTAEAERLERLVAVMGPADPADERARECTRELPSSSDNLCALVKQIERSKEPTATKLQNLERSLAPLRRTITFLTDLMEKGRDLGYSRSLGNAVAAVACQVTNACMVNDETFSSVSIDTLEAITEPFRFLKPLARHISRTAPERPPDATMPKNIIELASDGGKMMVNIFYYHPQGSQIAKIGNWGSSLLRALLSALWALRPALSFDLGLAPSAARALIFQWAKAYSHIHEFLAFIKCPAPHHLSGTVPFATQMIAAIAAATAEGSQEERETAFECIKQYAYSVILPQHIPRIKIFPNATEIAAMFEQSPAPAAIDALLDSVAALRDAAGTAGVLSEHALHANLLALYACMVGGLCIFHPAGAAPEAQLAALCSAPFTKSVIMAADAWKDVLRRSRDAPEFDFWAQLGQIGAIFTDFYQACSLMGKLSELLSPSLNPSKASVERALAAVAAPTAPAVSGLAAVASSMPAALALNGPPLSESKKFALAISTRLHLAALGYAHAAARCSGGSASSTADATAAAHACIHASLAIQASEIWQPLLAAEMSSGWLNAGLLANQVLIKDSSDEGVTAATLISLHSFTCVLGFSAQAKAMNAMSFHKRGYVDGATESFHSTRSIVLPEDAPAFELLLQTGERSAAPLRKLLKAAQSTEDIPGRQRRRLEMLGHLPPGVCANMLCTESLPASDKFKKCSGCMIARYCSARCSKADWKGHRAACKAVQRERGGG